MSMKLGYLVGTGIFGGFFVVTVIAPIRPLFDSDLYRQAEAFLLIDMFTKLVL